MSDNIVTREEALEALHLGVVHLEFTRADGTNRFMQATLKESFLPPKEPVDPDVPKVEKAINEDVVVCWDIDVAGWRSFRLDRVIQFAPVFDEGMLE